MAVLRYLTHPEVTVDPDRPIEQWELSAVGIGRVREALAQPWMASVGRVVSSGEAKAVQTASSIGEHLGVDVEVRTGLGENDRSATGFLPPEEFEQTADRFFARPDRSVRGWERAVDAQRRVVAGLSDLLEQPSCQSTVVVGHGGVGTLWYCWLTDQPIDRSHDQPGQGHYFTVDLSKRIVLHPWRPIDRAGSAG